MNLIQIGEAAKIYSISRRSLRYWEEKGILQSIRGENGYRMYDTKNLTKINQIIMLKKLELPIHDIYTIFISDDYETSISILKKHLENIKSKADEFSYLVLLIEMLIEKAEKNKNNSLFALMDTIPESHNTDMKKALFAVDERSKKMSNETRIVKLPKMTFACYSAESETPEDDCFDFMTKFVEENDIDKMDGFRHFGFNNPTPTQGNPIYGYEMWVVVPKDYDVPSPYWKTTFQGGLFASITCSLENIGERWKTLHDWVEESEKYDIDHNEAAGKVCLEEIINYDAFTTPNTSLDNMQLDLFLPLKEK